MVENEKDLESYILKALGSMQKMGKTPGNILVETSPQKVTLIIRSDQEPINFGPWTAVTMTHRDFQILTNMCNAILRGKK